jgi:hypothetical protein
MITTHRTKTTAALMIAVLALAVFFIFQKPAQKNLGANPTDANLPEKSAHPTAATFSTRPALDPVSSQLPTEADAAKRLDSALVALKSITNADDARKILAELRSYLDSLPPHIAAAVITHFLANPANNAITRIDFSIGQSGFLSGQPSLRVALLDWLGHIDPRQAGVVAAQVLATPTDADEWAVSLRNYARANPTPDSQAFLRAKTEELIRNPEWRVNPSIGFFESFDVLVHTRATESSGLLSELVADRSPEGKPLAHASFLTLDRLTFREPAAMMEQLAARPELTQARGEMVANLVARADLADPTQQQHVRSYLLDPSRTPAELSAFAGVFPNANFTLSKNLLSENMTLTRDEITTRDAAALAIVNNWLTDPAFAPVKSHLAAMHQRLTTFVIQSSATSN